MLFKHKHTSVALFTVSKTNISRRKKESMTKFTYSKNLLFMPGGSKHTLIGTEKQLNSENVIINMSHLILNVSVGRKTAFAH